MSGRRIGKLRQNFGSGGFHFAVCIAYCGLWRDYKYPTFFSQKSFSHSHNFFAPRNAAKSSCQ